LGESCEIGRWYLGGGGGDGTRGSLEISLVKFFRGLELCVAEAGERVEGTVVVGAVFDVPGGGFGTEVD